MKLLKTWLGPIFGFGPDQREALIPLYSSVVAEARNPIWYADHGVPDTLDGRFDMVSAILSLVLVRLDAEGKPGLGSSGSSASAMSSSASISAR